MRIFQGSSEQHEASNSAAQLAERAEKLVFISWALNCSRSDSIARHLEGNSYMVYSPFWGSRYSTIVFKYACQTVMTLRILFREKPRCVIVMTPPVVACFAVWLYATITNSSYIIDAHTAAFLGSPWHKLLFIHRFFSRRAKTTIVTNRYLKNIVENWGARATIVEDVPVYFAAPSDFNTNGKCVMTLVSTFTKDEPLEVFFDAVRQISDIEFFVTGDFREAADSLVTRKPANVKFTGFLPDSEYVGLVLASDAIIALTTEDHTMQRAAYEAVYLGKPVITSNTELLRQAFHKGAVHVDISLASIQGGILQMKQNLRQYTTQIRELRSEKLARWNSVEQELRNLIKTSGDAVRVDSGSAIG
jgi:glycosyltransferase involved in cell wall biosynthesis